MEELPLDIREEILVRLKAKDLTRYKYVCKSWYSLISSDCFVKSHLKYNLKKQADNNEIGDTRIVLSGPSSNDVACEIVGSSNGLVCLRFNRQYLVVNPSTHQLIKLISLPQNIEYYYSLMGFGYDSSIDDYKVVIQVKNTCTDKYSFLVLTLRSNVWRSVVGELNYHIMDEGVLCNGAIHSLAYDQYCQFYNPTIVSFDLSKECYKEIPTPMHGHLFFPRQYKLGTIKDRLCIFHCNSRTLSNQRVLWLMKNYKVQESESIWEQMLSPLPCDDSGHERMMDYVPRKSFSGHIHIWMLEEDSGAPVFVGSVESPSGKDHHIWLSTISACSYKYDEHVYVESLVSPHGMGNDNSKRTTKTTKLLKKNNPRNDMYVLYKRGKSKSKIEKVINFMTRTLFCGSSISRIGDGKGNDGEWQQAKMHHDI